MATVAADIRSTIEASIVRKVFWGPLYYNSNQDPPK